MADLYLVVEGVPDQTVRIAGLLDLLRPASVLVVPVNGQDLQPAAVLPLIKTCQAAGAAVLILDDARLARTLKADGVHLAWRDDILTAYHDAREILGSRYIVGVETGAARHDAMSLGEAGADYVAFAAPEDAVDDDEARQRRADLVAWWAEIFEIPCVALAAQDAADADHLALLGADFVGVRLKTGSTLAAEQQRLCDIATALRAVSAPERVA